MSLPPLDSALETSSLERNTQRGIQSVEVGAQLLLALGQAPCRSLSLGALARAAEMSPSKAHPYLVSFVKLGMIQQDAASGHYQLGPTLLQLGLVCLQRLDAVEVATRVVTRLATEVNQTLAVAVWGNLGPTVLRIFESPRPIHVNMRAGTVMALAGTATGRAFAAWMPPQRVAWMLQQTQHPAIVGQQHDADAATNWPRFERELSEIRQAGYARTEGRPIPGIHAVSAPIFDHGGNVVLVLTALGPADELATEADAPVTQAVQRAAREVSEQLGAFVSV